MHQPILLSICFLSGISNLHAQPNEKLWYTQPAATWTDALPTGNGRLGAMVFGKVNEELIQLNEATLWSGGPVPKEINPTAHTFLPQIRKVLLTDADYDKATPLAKKMQGLYTQTYLPLADLVIQQQTNDTAVTNYYRELDIQKAIITTRFTQNGVNYQREIFTSFPDQVIVVRLTASKPKQLNLKVSTKSMMRYQHIAYGNNELIMQGKAPAHVDPSYYNRPGRTPVIWEDTTGQNCNGMRFRLTVKALNKGGQISADTSGLSISNANEVLLILSAATSFNGFDKCPDSEGKDELELANAYLDKATKKSYKNLLKNHIADFRQYYNRVQFSIKDTLATNSNTTLPSNERLKSYSKGAYDPGVELLYFNYGRYLLISSSRPGGTPANLQGIWNHHFRAPWSSNYTININTQMNYWPAEVTNLSEMHRPLFDLINNIAVTGKNTAKEFYNAGGWVAHHNSDIWAVSNPVGDKGQGDPMWANWPQGGNWLCQHVWEHYRYTGDKIFLANTAYPLMKGAAAFCIDYLVKNKEGYWIVVPSTSPENEHKYGNNQRTGISVATTMDMSIIWDLFTNLIEASQILDTDISFRNELIGIREKLYPLQIGKKGNLQEWYKDYEDVDPYHRHVSHLFGLHPGRQIAPVSTPQFAAAARKTLEMRGDDGTGWSKAWKINFWARLLDGNHAHSLVKQLLNYSEEGNTIYSRGGGTYPNFFDAHPPFQIDGNFGGVAGMAEMLLQSHLGELHLLPALPDAWSAGEIKGLKARGNYTVSMRWRNQALTHATITSHLGGACQIRTKHAVAIKGVHAQSIKDGEYYVISFEAKQGVSYQIMAL